MPLIFVWLFVMVTLMLVGAPAWAGFIGGMVVVIGIRVKRSLM